MFALNDNGQVFYYQTSAASGDFYDIYTGNGTAVPTRVYLSPAFQSSNTIVGVYGASGFIGANNSGQVTFNGEITPPANPPYPSGIYGLSPPYPSTTPQLLAGSSESLNFSAVAQPA